MLMDLIATGGYRTQGQLVSALRERGQDVTQSTVSRELTARGVRKVGGRYVAPAERGLPPGVVVLEGAVARGPMLILKTAPAVAPMLAQALDEAGFEGVLGTIAGENTVFVACAPDADLAALRGFVSHPIPEGAAR